MANKMSSPYKHWGILLLIMVGTIGLGLSRQTSNAQADPTPTPTPAMSGMGDMDTDFSSDELVPLVHGIYNGDEVLFIHTEASDSEVADLLTDMMGPEVVVVPSLAEIPVELLGNVYVFTNGVDGGGPMGYQPDIFDSIPGDEAYTPLRAITLVTWHADVTPYVLNSVEEIEQSHALGEIELEQPGIVVNMPILVWPDGNR